MRLLWDSEAGAAERYQFAVGTAPSASSAPLVTRALSEDPSIGLVVVGPLVDLDEASRVVEAVRADRPEIGFLLLRHRLDVSTLGLAMRAGFREVVAADDAPALVDAVRRSEELSARLAGRPGDLGADLGKVVTVFSAKGGVGKTTLATNLAVQLATNGQRTVVVDLDLAFGDVAISLQLSPMSSVHDAVAMAGHIDGEGFAKFVTTHESTGLDVVAAPTDPSLADRIPAAVVTEVLQVAARHYDYVVVDTPPAFTEHVLAACDVSSLLVLIATLDVPAIKNLKLAIETLDSLGAVADNRVVVLNRADVKAGLHPDDVVRAIRAPIAVSVPVSAAVPASINRGAPLVIDAPRDAASAAIRQIAETHIQARFGAAPRADQRRRLFRRPR